MKACPCVSNFKYPIAAFGRLCHAEMVDEKEELENKFEFDLKL